MYNEEHYLPIDPKIKIKGVDSEDCKRFTSSQHPIKFTFKITQDTRNNCHFKDDIAFEEDRLVIPIEIEGSKICVVFVDIYGNEFKQVFKVK